MAGHEPSSCVAPTVLVEEPTSSFEELAGISVDASSFASIGTGYQNRFLTARDAVSPTLSTPTLVYSPMSTASSVSSDDGDRQLNLPDVSASSYSTRADMHMDFEQKAVGAFDSLAHLGQGIAGVKLAPIVDYHPVSKPPVLPPISEAVFNPVLLERGVHGAMGGSMDVGVSLYPGSVPRYG